MSSFEKIKCIWMASQVVEYKLCDNNFDCDACLFDKVIRNRSNKNEEKTGEIQNTFDSLESKIDSLTHDEKVFYLKNNLVVKEICYNTYYLGINPILNCFLDQTKPSIIKEHGSEIREGEEIIRISGSWGEVTITAPISFLLYDKGLDHADNHIISKWLAIIRIETPQLEYGTIKRSEWDLMKSKAKGIITSVKNNTPNIGVTMMDGGTQIKQLHQLIGEKKYIEILSSLIQS